MPRFDKDEIALNAICPYFTMFPLEFPLGILARHATQGETVLDPFCGRGTTNFAARLLGLYTVGVDSSPVASSITASKLARVTADEVVREAANILQRKRHSELPSGKFWRLAYHKNVLLDLCKFRAAFLEDCSSPARRALRGLLLGALHGPQQKSFDGYLSNQCPRTYAPKPAYATRFWIERGLKPRDVDVADVIGRRAKRFFEHDFGGRGVARLGDSRTVRALRRNGRGFDWVVTSPPYYGMRTYIPDQWLRNWFVGGTESVDYSSANQLAHASPGDFAADIGLVWKNCRTVCEDDAKMVIRFGGIADRHYDPKKIVRMSLEGSGWAIQTIKAAGNASDGKRQADTFLRTQSKPISEFVVWARAA